MKSSLLVLMCCLCATVFAFNQNSPQSGTGAKSATPPASTPKSGDCGSNPATSQPDLASVGADDLKNVLTQANKAAETFKTARSKFQWDQCEAVVSEIDVQKGDIFFRRTKSGMDAAVHVISPDDKKVVDKQVVFVDGTLKLYQPKIKQLTIYDAKAKRAEVDSLMNIGFGSRSDDILKSYDVKMEGWETVDGVKTARLNLVPKNEKLRASVTNIILWLDPQRDISIQQKFMEPGGNYRFTHYTGIELNGKVSNDVFELKTPAGTTTVRP
jgi:outer membrane lipoprotein-sorting protein